MQTAGNADDQELANQSTGQGRARHPSLLTSLSASENLKGLEMTELILSFLPSSASPGSQAPLVSELNPQLGLYKIMKWEPTDHLANI